MAKAVERRRRRPPPAAAATAVRKAGRKGAVRTVMRRQQNIGLHLLTAGQQMPQGGHIGIARKGARPWPFRTRRRIGRRCCPPRHGLPGPAGAGAAHAGQGPRRDSPAAGCPRHGGRRFSVFAGWPARCPHLAAARLAVVQQACPGEGRQQGRDTARVVDVGMAVDDGVQGGTGIGGQQGRTSRPGSSAGTYCPRRPQAGSGRAAGAAGRPVPVPRRALKAPAWAPDCGAGAGPGPAASSRPQTSRRFPAGGRGWAPGPAGPAPGKGRPWRAGPSSGDAAQGER